MGKMLKGLTRFAVAAATVGGVCYLFKDKIKESQAYEDYNIDEKITKVKKAVKEKIPKSFIKEEDIVAEDEIFFDDLDYSAENAERDYVSISSEDNAADKDEATEETEEATDSAEEPSNSEETKSDNGIPTINF